MAASTSTTGSAPPSDGIGELFCQFAKFGDTKADGSTITLKNVDKWLKQAKIIDKKITTTDTAITFGKWKSKQMDLKTFEAFIEDLARAKKLVATELFEKLKESGAPGTSGTTEVVKSGGVERLTDTSKYTGAHKRRFDESGKGRGIEGRENIAKNDGYVPGYKEKDTYDKKH